MKEGLQRAVVSSHQFQDSIRLISRAGQRTTLDPRPRLPRKLQQRTQVFEVSLYKPTAKAPEFELLHRKIALGKTFGRALSQLSCFPAVFVTGGYLYLLNQQNPFHSSLRQHPLAHSPSISCPHSTTSSVYTTHYLLRHPKPTGYVQGASSREHAAARLSRRQSPDNTQTKHPVKD